MADEDWDDCVYEDEEDKFERLADECGKTSRTGKPFRCMYAGTEHCDFKCPFRGAA